MRAGREELAPRHSGSGEPSDIGESFAIQIRTSHYHITSAFRMLRPNASTLEAALKLARGRSQTGGGALRHSQRQPEWASSTPTDACAPIGGGAAERAALATTSASARGFAPGR